ncbi:MAG: hypothetical protein AMK73_07640 [Planctomycetes bacterium SM23_32]|nr:MAG: hypothetical protein AMK73_07640 [Planctomycetes bacterium SM23_32]
MAEHELNVAAFGAVGDGQTDDTSAIQDAVDAAAEVGGTVGFPAGVYLCSTVRLRPHVGVAGEPTWSYREPGGATLRLADPDAACLLDLTGAFGATVAGLCLEGGELGGEVHGILVGKPDYGKQEDTPRIERCRVARFTGDGIRLWRIWCFSVRHCMVAHNRGCGLRLRGWDGFVLDNWFSGNGAAGFGAYDENASVTMTGNRVEWNRGGGIVIRGGNHYNIGDNYIDRSGGPGVDIRPEGDRWSHTVSVAGNVIYRSGKPDWPVREEHDSCHARLEAIRGLTFSANAMDVGRDDGGRGEWSPDYGIVYGRLETSVLSGNVLEGGALKELLADLGGHGQGVVVRDNPGSLYRL